MSPTEVTELLLANELRFHLIDSDSGAAWLLFCGIGTIQVALSESGENLLIRSELLCSVENGTAGQRRVLIHAMDENEKLLIGRFVGSSELYFEVPVSMAGEGRVNDQQFLHALSVVVAQAALRRQSFGSFAVE